MGKDEGDGEEQGHPAGVPVGEIARLEAVWIVLLTVVGLLSVIAGTVCAVVALVAQYRSHAPNEEWPTARRIRRLARRLLRRPPPSIYAVGNVTGPAATVSGTGVVSPPTEIAAGAPVEEQLRVFARRLELVEQQITADRTRQRKELKAVENNLIDVRAAIKRTNDSFERRIKESAISTLELQVIGLVLVGFGSVLLAVPALLDLF